MNSNLDKPMLELAPGIGHARSARLGTFFSLLLLLSLGAAPAWAQSNAGTAKASAGAAMSQEVWPFDQYSHNPKEVVDHEQAQPALVSGSAINAATAGTASFSSSAGFMATPGGVHVSAVASASTSGTPGWTAGGGSSAYADAATGDSFTLFAPAYAPGTLLTVNASVFLHGSAGAAAGLANGSGSYDALSSWQARVSVWNPSMLYAVQQTGSGNCWSNPSVPNGCGGAGFSTLALQFTVANGQTTSLSISGSARAAISAHASNNASAGGNAFADLSHTIGWGGIGSLMDGSGQLVGDYTAISAGSGFDYRQAYVSAVPEPAPWLLLVAGLAAVTRRRVRRPTGS